MESKCSLENLLKAVLGQANKEQNASYPPYIFDAHVNSVTSYLLSRIAELFPDNQTLIDIAEPFLKTQNMPVINGHVAMPNDYRNYLIGNVSVFEDYSGECGSDKTPTPVIENNFNQKTKKSACIQSPITLVDQSEWALRTRSLIIYPTYEEPIGCFFGSKKLRICPYDIKFVEISYLRQEKNYRYGYIEQPDDTYIFDPKTTEESEWTSAAFEPLFKGLNLLYATYTRDNELKDWNMILKQTGLI